MLVICVRLERKFDDISKDTYSKLSLLATFGNKDRNIRKVDGEGN